MPEKRKRVGYATYCVDRFVPERNINLMPLEFRKQVCQCTGRDDQEGYLWIFDDRGTIKVCTACNKPESYYLHRCVSCENLFLHDFDAAFCYKAPKCWDCINEDPDCCEGHNYCISFLLRKDWIPPVLPKPKTFTEEELAGVFDFD